MNEEINKEITEEEIFRAWTGKNDEFYNKMNYRKFNWCMFFFGAGYLFYRRMNVEAILYWVLQNILCAIIQVLFGITAGLIVSLMIAIGAGFAFYPMYRWNFKRKMNKYRLEKGYTNEQLMIIAKEKGGVSWTVILIIFIPVMICLFILLIGVSLNVYYGANGIMQQSTQQNIVEKSQNTVGIGNTNSIINNSNINNASTENKAKLVLEQNEYSIQYDTNKWKEINMSSIGMKKSLQYNKENENVILGYGEEEYVDPSYYNFSDYNSVQNVKTILDAQVKQIFSNSGYEIVGNNGVMLTANGNYYYKVRMSKDGGSGIAYVVLEKKNNKLLSFLAATDKSYLDSNINNEIVDMITNLEVQ